MLLALAGVSSVAMAQQKTEVVEEFGVIQVQDKYQMCIRDSYKGIVLHCTTKRVAKQVRKFLKQIPEEEWMDAIRLTFNAGDTPKVQAEQGLFAPGDNAYVDDLVFKGKDATPVLSFPFTAVQGRKQKGPDSWQEVREPLVTAYRNYLETHWVAKLRAAGKVEIDQEVLKTVNNH